MDYICQCNNEMMEICLIMMDETSSVKLSQLNFGVLRELHKHPQNDSVTQE